MSNTFTPSKKSWVEIKDNSDFSFLNLPFGIFKTNSDKPRVGVRIGDYVIDLKTLFILGYLENLSYELSDFDCNYLNSMMKKGKKACKELRLRLLKIFDANCSALQKNEHHVKQVLIPINFVEMCMPIQIGDYTDFYSSKEHATNVGMMFRDPANALLPNWLWIPVGYHGRASSVILSGNDIHRPKGQIKPDPNNNPFYAPCRNLDFELETAFITFDGKPLGHSISTTEAEDYIFGMVILNDWSARDIQTWEYVPLGPFLSKNFASSISPWVVTLDALEPFRCETPKQEPEVLEYLKFDGLKSYDINLEVFLTPLNGSENKIVSSNFKYLYWNMAQQLAHHTVNGCNIRCGDLMGSGTISGATQDSYGSMLELTWKGTKPLRLNDNSERKFLNDYDEVTMRAYADNGNVRVGFGEVKNLILPSL